MTQAANARQKPIRERTQSKRINERQYRVHILITICFYVPMVTGLTRAFARKWSEANLMRWEIPSDRFQAKVCQHHGASERKRSESCKVTSLIHMSSKQRRRRVFLQTVTAVTLVELCIDRVKLQGVRVCVCEGLCACVIFIIFQSSTKLIPSWQKKCLRANMLA